MVKTHLLDRRYEQLPGPPDCGTGTGPVTDDASYVTCDSCYRAWDAAINGRKSGYGVTPYPPGRAEARIK